jgi:hypothetical protein
MMLMAMDSLTGRNTGSVHSRAQGSAVWCFRAISKQLKPEGEKWTREMSDAQVSDGLVLC